MRNLIFFIIATWSLSLSAQVQLRDSALQWQHHAFELNSDYSLKSHTTDDNNIQEVTFNAKVIENELIRLVLVPEYGGRVISFVYKPAGLEYLYQSECGSAYGINEGNFYYNWLMVYGGIFPTFPEPEHGKSWLVPWEYSVIKNTTDTVTVQMSYTDNNQFNGTPGKFNNGITNITCQVEVSVYKECSQWDFDVTLVNNNNTTVNYEYWTCTTLTPGCETGETRSPLNSEMIVPISEYKANWSPGSWIGSWNGLYPFENINYLYKWKDMGIAYAHQLQDDYWGVINQDNAEGIFRRSENIETPGMKFWTWGKNNIDNNLYDYSNGGADNYIELWAGTSHAFFEDAILQANQVKSWKESYVATSGLTNIKGMNEELALGIEENQEHTGLNLHWNKFRLTNDYSVSISLEGMATPFFTKDYNAEELIAAELISFEEYQIQPGQTNLIIKVLDSNNKLLMECNTTLNIVALPQEFVSEVSIKAIGNNTVLVNAPDNNAKYLQLIDISGRVLTRKPINKGEVIVQAPQSGIYLLQIQYAQQQKAYKVWFR